MNKFKTLKEAYDRSIRGTTIVLFLVSSWFYLHAYFGETLEGKMYDDAAMLSWVFGGGTAIYIAILLTVHLVTVYEKLTDKFGGNGWDE